MLYIVTALYEEALPFLQTYNLKRDTSFPHFELFSCDDMLLLVTKPGALRAATALSSLLTAFPPKSDDLLLSIGCAGAAKNADIGNAFTICKIIEDSSGRTRYPELLYRPAFPEAEVITVAKVQTDTPSFSKFATPSAPLLYDMEAAGIYEAAIPYLPCHRILFVKVVSDPLTGLLEFSSETRRAHVTKCISHIMPELTDWLLCILRHKEFTEKNFFTAEEESFFARVNNALRLSTASSFKLRQLMLYLKLSGTSYLKSMSEQLAIPLHTPCRTKKEGLKYLEQLNRFYL